MYTLDTNAIIYFTQDEPETVAVLTGIVESNLPLYVSTITEIELFGYSAITAEETEKIEEILKTTTIISVDSRLARIAGTIRSLYRLGIADSTIAATALVTGSTLLTRNIKDFKKVPNLLLQKI
jgi:predicted nucleic acid-binding protein